MEKSSAARHLHQIIQKEDRVILEDQNGVEIGNIKLPVITFNPRGLWKVGEIYTLNDLVTYETKAYVCRKPNKGEAFDDDHWQELFNLSAKE